MVNGHNKCSLNTELELFFRDKNYKTYYWVKIVALKGKKNFISIKPTKPKLTILSKNYCIVKKTDK